MHRFIFFIKSTKRQQGKNSKRNFFFHCIYTSTHFSKFYLLYHSFIHIENKAICHLSISFICCFCSSARRQYSNMNPFRHALNNYIKQFATSAIMEECIITNLIEGVFVSAFFWQKKVNFQTKKKSLFIEAIHFNFYSKAKKNLFLAFE